jgi:PPOX class probable F420-dependent enzyme
VTAGVDDAGRVVISVTEDRAKTRNVRRDPRAVLCVFTDRWYGPWTQLEGTADVLSLPDALEPLVEYYRTTRGEEHPDWDDYRAAMVRDRRALIRVTVARVAGTRPAS